MFSIQALEWIVSVTFAEDTGSLFSSVLLLSPSCEKLISHHFLLLEFCFLLSLFFVSIFISL